MIYKVGILGATGKMGQEIAALLSSGFSIKEDTLEFVDAVSGSKKITSVDGVPIRLINETVFDPAHVWIDFSTPSATIDFLKVCDTPLVIGTTGFSDEQRILIQAYSLKKPVLIAPNMSPGMHLMMKMLRTVVLNAERGFNDVVLSEAHHVGKKDSPSGTAKQLLSILKENGSRNVQLQVTRAGLIRGEHSVRFISDDEELIIEHRVMDRKVFAKGAILAAYFIVNQKPGLYSIQDMETK